MVARTPPKHHRKTVVATAAPPLSPTLLRDTVKKVDKCMARLQELQYTVTGGRKMISGVSMSPRNNRISLRCKQDSFRTKNASGRRSPPGKLPVNTEEWRRMSLPAMLLGETMGEILQASQFARNIVEAVSSSTTKKPSSTTTTDDNDPKTPTTERTKQHKPSAENSGLLLQARRRREKQSEPMSSHKPPPSLQQRAKSRINFKVSSPVQRECDKENCRYIANRVSPRNRPWARKTVLFPNPLFHSSSSSPNKSHHQKFCKTKSPVITRNNNNKQQKTPHKFLIKSTPPPAAISASKFQVKIKSPPLCISPTRNLGKRSSPPKAAAPSAAAKLRRSLSPSRLANRLVSPLKSRKPSSVQKNEVDGMKIMMSGLKQRPASFSMRFSPRRV